MLGTLTKLPKDVRNLLYTIPGVGYKLLLACKAFGKDSSVVMVRKRMTLPISGKNVLGYLLSIQSGGDNDSRPKGVRFSAFLPTCEVLMWRVIFSIKPGDTIRAEDTLLTAQNRRNGIHVTFEERKKNMLTGFQRLSSLLVGIEELYPSYYTSVEILMRRFPSNTPRLVAHNMYCMFLRKNIDNLLATYQLSYRCVFIKNLEPSSFVVSKDKSKARLLYRIVQKDADPDRFLPLIMHLRMLSSVHVDGYVSNIAHREATLRAKYTVIAYSKIYAQFHTSLTTFIANIEAPQPITARKLLAYVKKSISVCKLGFKTTFNLCFVAGGEYYRHFVSVRHKEDGLKIKVEDDLISNVEWLPENDCEAWNTLQTTLRQLNRTPVIVSSGLAEKLCNMQEYVILLRQQLYELCASIGIELEDLLGHSPDGSARGEARVHNRLTEYNVQLPYTKEQSILVSQLTLLCHYIHVVCTEFAIIPTNYIILIHRLIAVGQRLGMYTFMQ